MMPEPLLNELEQTAKRTSVREALICAYQEGEAKAYKQVFMDSAAKKLQAIHDSRCIAAIPTNSTGEEAVECERPVVEDSSLCKKHAENL